jgi:hypothetical protein
MYESWSIFHRREVKDELRKIAHLSNIKLLEMSTVQYEAASHHPIFFEVLRLAILSDPRVSFWLAQYQWLGINDPNSISSSGVVNIQFHTNTFEDERALYLKMLE